MLKMDHANMTQAMLDAEARNVENNNSNEYFYVLIVMSFYGIFLIGIMLGYMKSKSKEKKSNLLLLYKDEEREWEKKVKPLPTISGLKSVQIKKMLNMLQESMVPSLSCAICSMEGSSVSSESSSPDVHFTIQEEVLDAELGEVSETLLNESSEGSAENIHKNS
ncbi:KCNE4 protein, partial [Lophotis ruficrista]|nr:KCNE4 protein [Lophotis ruficrista]